jgi:hypothetical protein
MNKLLYPLTVFLLAGSLFGAAGPFAGTWRLNVAKSTFGGTNKPPKEETMVLQEQGDNFVQIIKGIGADGSPISSKMTVSKTGGEDKYSEGGPPAGTSRVLSKRKADARTLDSTTMQDGKVIQTLHAVISDDGKSMRVNIKRTDAQGKSSEGVILYDRQ